MKIRTFFNETFGFEVHLLVGCTPKQFTHYVRCNSKPNYKNPGKFYAICRSKLKHVIIGLSQWKADAYDIAALSHELQHATFNSLKKRGIKHCGETDEVFSYLHDSLLRRSLQALGVK